MPSERPDAPLLHEVPDAAALEAVIDSPRAVLFKHSTRCGVSAYVIEEVIDFAETHPEWPVHVLKVIEQRPLSNEAAERLGVRHESPQAFVLDRGRVRWHGSHNEVSAAALQRETGRLEMSVKTAAIVTLLGVVCLAPLAGAQSASLRTPWGDPDLQGIWTGSTLTPLERPARFAGQEFLTEEEAAGLERRADETRFVERVPTAGDPGTYNQTWFDPGTRLVPDRRTALITDPPDGRVPYTPEMAERGRLQAIYRVSGARNTWVDVDTGERCMSDGVPMFWLGYNPNHQIFQTPDHVVIVHEMFRDRRIVPLGDGPGTGIRQWNGDMRGHWEGDTLVVESTHFIDGTADRWAQTWRMPTHTMHLVERFTRLDADTLQYEFTLTDPAKFTAPWSVRIPLTTNQASRGVTEGPLYEYACHEGNYSIANVLRGARVEELAADDEQP